MREIWAQIPPQPQICIFHSTYLLLTYCIIYLFIVYAHTHTKRYQKISFMSTEIFLAAGSGMCLQGLKQCLTCNRCWMNICLMNSLYVPGKSTHPLWASVSSFIIYRLSIRRDNIQKCSAQNLDHNKQSRWPKLLNIDDIVVSNAKGAWISIDNLLRMSGEPEMLSPEKWVVECC